MNKNLMILSGALVLLVGSLAACKSSPAPRPSDNEQAKEAPQEPAEPALEPFVVTYNGEDMGMKTLIGYSHGGQGLRLSFSSASPTCEDFKGFGRGLAPNEKYLDMTIAPQVADDGSASWQIRSLFVNSRNVIEQGPVEVIQAGPEGQLHARFDTTIEFEASEFLGQEAGTLVIKGDMLAENCGVIPKDKEAVAEEHPGLKVTLGDQTLAIRSAKVVGGDLILGTEALSCADSSIGQDLHIRIKLEYGTLKPQSVVLNGDLISQNINIGFDPLKSTFKVPENLDGDDPREFELDFSFTSPPLTVQGKVTAQNCD